MSNSIDLAAEKRELTGKKVKNLRAEGKLPATVYQLGKDSVNVSLNYQEFFKAYQAAGLGQPVQLDVAGEKRLAMIKQVDVDPARHVYRHVEFHAVRADREVEAEIPVHIIGEIPAEKAGNFLVHPNNVVIVKAKPANLPESFEISGEKLAEPGDSLTAEELQMPQDVELISDPSIALAVVEEPRKVEEPEETEEVDAADVPSDNGGEESSDSDSSDSTEKSE